MSSLHLWWPVILSLKRARCLIFFIIIIANTYWVFAKWQGLCLALYNIISFNLPLLGFKLLWLSHSSKRGKKVTEFGIWTRSPVPDPKSSVGIIKPSGRWGGCSGMQSTSCTPGCGAPRQWCKVPSFWISHSPAALRDTPTTLWVHLWWLRLIISFTGSRMTEEASLWTWFHWSRGEDAS